jgi:hypothetical protein
VLAQVAVDAAEADIARTGPVARQRMIGGDVDIGSPHPLDVGGADYGGDVVPGGDPLGRRVVLRTLGVPVAVHLMVEGQVDRVPVGLGSRIESRQGAIIEAARDIAERKTSVGAGTSRRRARRSVA